MPAQHKDLVALRLTPADHQEIIRRAEARGITKTQLLVDSALERLPPTQDELRTLDSRLEAVESAVDRLERFTELGAT